MLTETAPGWPGATSGVSPIALKPRNPNRTPCRSSTTGLRAPAGVAPTDFALDADDRAVIVGEAIYVNRLTTSGADDPTFGDGGNPGGGGVRNRVHQWVSE